MSRCSFLFVYLLSSALHPHTASRIGQFYNNWRIGSTSGVSWWHTTRRYFITSLLKTIFLRSTFIFIRQYVIVISSWWYCKQHNICTSLLLKDKPKSLIADFSHVLLLFMFLFILFTNVWSSHWNAWASLLQTTLSICGSKKFEF